MSNWTPSIDFKSSPHSRPCLPASAGCWFRRAQLSTSCCCFCYFANPNPKGGAKIHPVLPLRDIFQGRAFALFPNANRTAKPNRARGIRRTDPELEFALLELKRTELRTNTPSTTLRAQRQGRLPFYIYIFFEKHTWSSSDVPLSPGVLFKSFSVPLLKASQIRLELYPIVLLLCAFIEYQITYLCSTLKSFET
jgi:hypothetical protein